MNNKQGYKEFMATHYDLPRAPFDPELEFYAIIQSGDMHKATKLCEEQFSEKAGLGILSQNPIKNVRYHLIITIAMIARYCIEGGLDVSLSYSLSDYYIQKADCCHSVHELDQLHNAAVLDYASRMKDLRKEKVYSKPIVKCIDYISEHLHTKLSVSILADYVDLNSSYLSRLFKNELGITISEYIKDMRIETAKNMLLYSDYTAAQIASILAFADQSYFTEVFKKATGMTPSMYRSRNLRKTKFKR